MLESIEEAARRLKDSESGWVTRRDAALELGQAATRALEVLQAASDEMDVDVRRVITQVLGEASAALRGIDPQPRLKVFSLEELAKACAKEGVRVVAPHGDGYVVQVQLKSGRRQAVYLVAHKLEDGKEVIRIYTECGKPADKLFAWALKANMNLMRGALALASAGDEDRLVVTSCYPVDVATPREVKASVKELAYYADWIERKLTGQDDF